MEPALVRSEEHTSELQSRNDISYAVFCLKKKRRKIHSMCQHYSSCSLNQLLERQDLNRLRSDFSFFFFVNETTTTEIYTSLHTLSLHDALPISSDSPCRRYQVLRFHARGGMGEVS